MFAWSNPTIVVVVLCVELPTGAEEAVSRQSQSEAISRDAAGGSGEVRYTHRSTILTPRPWISYKGGGYGGFWDVSGRMRGKGGCLFCKPPFLLLSGKARGNGSAFGSPVALLPERRIPKTEVVSPAIILEVPLCFFPLFLFFVSLVVKTRPVRPVNIVPMICFSSPREFRPLSVFEQTIKKVVI